LKALIEDNEERFVDFFNNATPVTPRRHAFELLPGVGNRHMQKLIDEREKEEFDSFEDIRERVSTMPDPEELITDRIVEELKGEAKRRLFT